jgi:calpain-5
MSRWDDDEGSPRRDDWDDRGSWNGDGGGDDDRYYNNDRYDDDDRWDGDNNNNDNADERWGDNNGDGNGNDDRWDDQWGGGDDHGGARDSPRRYSDEWDRDGGGGYDDGYGGYGGYGGGGDGGDWNDDNDAPPPAPQDDPLVSRGRTPDRDRDRDRGRGRDPADVDLSIDSEDDVPTRVAKPHTVASEAPGSKAAMIADGLTGLFEDPDFPATQASLGGDIGKDVGGDNTIVWLRPSEVAGSKNPSLFKDGSHSSDVCQGGVGDCWLCGGLSVLATRDDLIKRVVLDDKHAKQGMYAFKFYLDGVWEEVIVDDRLPYLQCGKGFTFPDGRNVKPLMASSKDPNELWSGLCEKAFAKCRGGSYAALDGGYVTDALVDLTGGAPFVYAFADEPTASQIKDGSFVKNLHRWSESGHYLMSCALLKDGAGREEDQGKGVLSGHAYGILKVVEYKGEVLVCIRNPWGQTEVTHGKWSDADVASWTPEALRDLGHSLGDDGTFWMAADDFFATFTDMDVCRLLPDNWATITTRGAFSKDLGTAGGCPNTEQWTESPQYLLKVAAGDGGDGKPREFVISLQQDDIRGKGTKPSFIGVKVHSVGAEHHGKLDYLDPATEVADSGPFRPAREVSVAVKLPPGKYVIAAMTFAPGEEALYRIHVSAPQIGKGGRSKGKDDKGQNRDGDGGGDRKNGRSKDRGGAGSDVAAAGAFTVKSLDAKNDPQRIESKPPRVEQPVAETEDGKVVRGVPKTVDLPRQAKKGKYTAKKGRVDDFGVKGLLEDIGDAWKDLEMQAKKNCKCAIQ